MRIHVQLNFGPRDFIVLAEPQSKLGGPWIPLGGPQSKLEEPLRKLHCWEGLGSSRVSLGASWASIPGMWWYHRSSSPTGPLPKKGLNPHLRFS